MLFNSPEFLFLFLPLTLLAFHGLKAWGRNRTALLALLAASLFFYGWWNPPMLVLLMASIACNYAIGRAIMALPAGGMPRKVVLTLGIAANLYLLGYYKYALFLLSIWAGLTGTAAPGGEAFLPLGISFFTFTQVSYLADLHTGRTRPDSVLSYALFVTFFPHLIAGPIVHHRELAGQFTPAARAALEWDDVAAGLTLLAGGLFKKVVLADTLALHVGPIFASARNGDTLDFITAWGGALAYTFQLYFDFSGYSDIAIGLALLFAIRLPINFNSPYKAVSIIDFWHRWHITLSHWLRDYLYIPLGGSRHGRVHQAAAVVTTMVLGGLWHGAGWTFLVWGAGHGALLAVNHVYRALRGDVGTGMPLRVAGWAVTFLAVAALWVVFRSPDLATAGHMLTAMANPTVLPGFMGDKLGGIAHTLTAVGWSFAEPSGPALIGRDLPRLLLLSLIVVTAAPNLYNLLHAVRPYLEVRGVHPYISKLAWRPSALWAIAFGAMFAYAALNSMVTSSEFLYFQF